MSSPEIMRPDLSAPLTPAAKRDLARLRAGESFVLCYGPWQQLADAGLVTGTQHDARAVPVPADVLRRSSDVRRVNMQRATRTQAEVVEECFVCGRGLTESGLARSSWIEHTTSGYLVAVAAESPADSQGCFPVGSECSKSVPAAFRLKAIR